jgi:hypothetical protein
VHDLKRLERRLRGASALELARARPLFERCVLDLAAVCNVLALTPARRVEAGSMLHDRLLEDLAELEATLEAAAAELAAAELAA